MAILDFISRTHLAAHVVMLSKLFKIFHVIHLFLIYHSLNWGCCPSDYLYPIFLYSVFIS
jgi:hypothetical protein